MKLWQKCIVYRSKNEADWNEAKRLLSEAGIEHFPVTIEEVQATGCGGKVDPRKFLGGGKADSRLSAGGDFPTTIYRIEVAKSDRERAEAVLDGKVQPVRSYGYSI